MRAALRLVEGNRRRDVERKEGVRCADPEHLGDLPLRIREIYRLVRHVTPLLVRALCAARAAGAITHPR